MEIDIRLLSETAIFPTHGSEYSAGYDLSADINKPIFVQPHSTLKIPTGIAVAIPEGYFGGIYARSGIATREGLRPANCTGVIDSDYRGEVIVAIHNDTDYGQTIEPQERIAQLVIQPFLPVTWRQVDNLNTTERGEGGFGSTGKS